MKEIAFLIVGPKGIKGFRKSRPSLNWNEISVKVNLDIPDIMFKRPHVEASIKVEEDAINPIEIKPEVLINTKELIEQQSGMKVDFNVLHQQVEKKVGCGKLFEQEGDVGMTKCQGRTLCKECQYKNDKTTSDTE